MPKELEKEFDFTKVEKRIFKALTGRTGKHYQVLIKDALKYFIEEKLEPKIVWKK